MSKGIDELLAVLDMPENEQNKYCWHNLPRKSWESLADLAFRLRDEMWIEDAFGDALVLIYKKCSDVVANVTDCFAWFVLNAQPIHWIIAALITKQLAKENNGKDSTAKT